MSVMMERSSTAFERLEEEHLRDFYLVVLNGHYEGRARRNLQCGRKGTTRHPYSGEQQERLIAECEYWHGPQTVTDALDQLLAYLTWRDTKAALVMFNRNKNFTAMVKKMVETATEHPNCKRGPTQETETRFRYVFASKDDPAREIILNVMAIDVPRTRLNHDGGIAELPQGSAGSHPCSGRDCLGIQRVRARSRHHLRPPPRPTAHALRVGAPLLLVA